MITNLSGHSKSGKIRSILENVPDVKIRFSLYSGGSLQLAIEHEYLREYDCDNYRSYCIPLL